MKNIIKRTGIVFGVGVILLGATVAFSEPGSETDPLVTLSYVETKMEQIKYYIDEKVKGVNTGSNINTSWAVVEVPAGKSLICKDGTEIILRAGEARSISKVSIEIKNGVEIVTDNGLTDVTEGKDLKMDQLISKDHLLIVPRDDGRGAYCKTNSFFLVKGAYEIR